MKASILTPPGIESFISFLSLRSWVASKSSENVNVGTDNDYVMVLVMAFLIPTIFWTLSCSMIWPRDGPSGTETLA